MRKHILSALLMLASIPGWSTEIANISYPDIDKYLEYYKLSRHCTEKNFPNLQYHMSVLAYSYKSLQYYKSGDDLQDLRERAKFIAYIQPKMAAVAELPMVDRRKCEAYEEALRMIYVLRNAEVPPARMDVGDFLGVLNRINTSMQWMDLEDRVEKLNEDAKYEALNLVSPQDPSRFISIKEMGNMNAVEVSGLDISENHTIWRRFDQKKLVADPNEKHILSVQEKVRVGVEADDTKDLGPYDIRRSARVMTIDKLKVSSTAPKLVVKDLYGQKWKMKWGLETQTEPVVNQLYMLAGGRYSDITLSLPHGLPGNVLVLDDVRKKSSCDNINNLAWLKYCFLKSGYKFDISAYVHDVGVLTEKNASMVLGVSPAILGTKRIKKLLGRNYVTFREVSVEFSPGNVVIEGGAWAKNLLNSTDDRVQRGLLVFNTWVANNDDKEDNGKGILVTDPVTKEKTFIEYESDFGASLGSNFQAGLVNGISTGSSYASIGRSLFDQSILNAIPWRPIGDKRVFFHMTTPFRPRAWEQATFADGRWMAKHISSITIPQIRKAVYGTQWPTFMNEALVYKLVSRRNRVAEIFGTERFLDTKVLKAPQIWVDLSGPERRKKVAEDYHLEPVSFEKSFKSHKLDKKNKYTEWLVYDGEVVSCKKSFLVNILERTWHPTGLTRRITRTSDDKPLSSCHFGPQQVHRR